MLGLAVGLSGIYAPALAYPLVIVEARHPSLKPGGRIDSAAAVTLKPGEKLVVIAPDGRINTLRGTYNGPASQTAAVAQDPQRALAALISTRGDRARSVGAVRSGANAAALPDPWLVDISRPGERCIKETERPIWWRPESSGGGAFSVYPVDRSWRANFVWEPGQDRILSPDLVRVDGVKMMIIQTGTQERPIRLHLIPKDLIDPVVVTAWMLEKACVQQADALLRQIAVEVEAQASEPQTSAPTPIPAPTTAPAPSDPVQP